MNRRPERLADLLPGVVADLAARHNTTNGAPMTEPADPVIEAVNLLHACRHQLEPDVLRSLGSIWACASAARYGEPYEEFWVALDEDGFYSEHDTGNCEAENQDSAA